MPETIGAGGFDPSHGIIGKDGSYVEVSAGEGYGESPAAEPEVQEEPVEAAPKARKRSKGA